MIKKYRLKPWVIELLLIIAFTIYVITCVTLYMDRVNNINNWDRSLDVTCEK